MTQQTVRLYHPSRHTMQMGRGKTKYWILEFVPPRQLLRERSIDPIMNWPQTCDTDNQKKLRFPTREDALRYAKKHDFRVDEIVCHHASITPKSYASNFSPHRRT